MSALARVAFFVRGLCDDHLNDLLVELPRERFGQLVEDALATPEVGVPVRYHSTSPRPGEATRWTIKARRLLHPPDGHGLVPAWTALGAVAQQQATGPRGGRPVAWHASTSRGESVADPAGRGWPTRKRAVAALLWHCPASGARCAVLAAHVRALCDDHLNDLLADLPPRRFAALLLAALDVADEGGVAA
jgi:hypothetical protein